MTAPDKSAYSSTVPKSGTNNIDSLLGGYKWGYALSNTSTPLTISYSFPWINGLTAVFSGPGGSRYSSLDEQLSGFGLNATQQTAATLVLSAWSNVANFNFQLVSETTTNVGDIRFAFSSASSISNYWGWARYPDNTPSAGDIWINAKYGSDTNWAVGTRNFKILMHEIGHALGLKHPFEGNVVLSSNLDNGINTIMSYTDIKNVYPNVGYAHYIYQETPMVFDIAAIQYIYGANNNYKTGDDTYIFDPTMPFFKTIWDAGGKDTISISNFSTACIVDLTPGNYSSLSYPPPSNTGGATVTYDGTNNLGIAFNCIIENAIGGSGNDKLIGNSANNILDGGAGNDQITGGGGNDSLNGGAGIDTVVYASNRSNYTLTKGASTYTVTDKTGANGTDTLTNVENLTFSNVTIPTSIDLFLATKGTAVAARGAVDVASAIATQMSVVYLGRPADKTLLLDLKTSLDNGQPLEAVLNLIAAKAIQDGAFAASNSSKDIVVNTFNNIMGFLPSAFEQTEWAKYIDNGTLTKANAPWIIFQSYLGANNVPDVYKLPTQARFVAAQTFSDYAFLDANQAGLASLNSVYANAARKWLAPVASVSHAASKMQTMIADIESVTLTGVAPVDTFVG